MNDVIVAPTWFRVLRHYQQGGFDDRPHNALTFPLLVAAERFQRNANNVYESATLTELTALVESVRRQVVNACYIKAYRCDNLDKIVARIVNNSPPPADAIAVPNPEAGASSLYVARSLGATDNGPFDFLIDAIWSEAGTSMKHGLLSCNHDTKQFEKVTPGDIKLFTAALKA
jgi:hypothetical protein